jgi:hypothetical protein
LFEKTGPLGTKIDIVLAIIRIGLFFGDKLFVKKQVDRANILVESGVYISLPSVLITSPLHSFSTVFPLSPATSYAAIRPLSYTLSLPGRCPSNVSTSRPKSLMLRKSKLYLERVRTNYLEQALMKR